MPLRGSVYAIRWRDPQTGATTTFAYDSLPTVAVIEPDGDTLSPAITVTDAAGYATSATSHELVAYLPLTQAGVYRVKWTREIGSETLISPEEVYFSSWTGPEDWVRGTLLGVSDSDLTDETLQELMADALEFLPDWASALRDDNGYGGLTTAADKSLADKGLGFLAALGWVNSPGGHAHRITRREKYGPVEYEYADSSSASSSPAAGGGLFPGGDPATWEAKGLRLLGRLSGVSGDRQSWAEDAPALYVTVGRVRYVDTL